MSKILVFLGSMRDGRNGERVATLTMDVLRENGLDPELIDPLTLIPELQTVVQPLNFRPNPEEAPEEMRTLNEKIINADGFVLLSAEYNASLPPTLISVLDNFGPTSYRHRPCGIITYSVGDRAGNRAAFLLRPVITELLMCPIPTALTVSSVTSAIDEEGKANDEATTHRFNKFAKQLIWYVEAMKKQKEEKGFPE